MKRKQVATACLAGCWLTVAWASAAVEPMDFGPTAPASPTTSRAVDPNLPVFEDRVEVNGHMAYLAPVEMGDSVELRFGIGELEVRAVDALEVRTEVNVECRELSQARCDKYRKQLRFEAVREGSVLKVAFRGLPKWKMRKLQLTGQVFYPKYVPLMLHVGIGEADISVGAEDVAVDMGIGDLTVRVSEQAVSSIAVRTRIGDARILGVEPREGRRVKLVGARLDWQDGLGDSRIQLKLGIGDAKVVLE